MLSGVERATRLRVDIVYTNNVSELSIQQAGQIMERADDVLERPKKRAASTRVRSEANIHIRAPQQTKRLIETAAVAVGKTLSEFVLDSARQQAVDVLLDQRLFVLDPEQYDAFVRALDAPAPAGEKLRALMKRKPLWQK
jgi:uncharacterized protein (DUF1778 family)